MVFNFLILRVAKLHKILLNLSLIYSRVSSLITKYKVMKHGFLRVATAQPLLKVADCQYNAEQIVNQIAQCIELGVDVVLFPAHDASMKMLTAASMSASNFFIKCSLI